MRTRWDRGRPARSTPIPLGGGGVGPVGPTHAVRRSGRLGHSAGNGWHAWNPPCWRAARAVRRDGGGLSVDTWRPPSAVAGNRASGVPRAPRSAHANHGARLYVLARRRPHPDVALRRVDLRRPSMAGKFELFKDAQGKYRFHSGSRPATGRSSRLVKRTSRSRARWTASTRCGGAVALSDQRTC